MISISKVLQATSNYIKVLRFGRNDVQTADVVLPHGIDSKPVKDRKAVFGTTTNKQDTVCLGYLYESETTTEGETRIYATDSDGAKVFDILLKNDGTCEFNGTGDFFVRYNALDSGLQSFVNDLNAKLVTAFSSVGGSWPGTSLDVSDAKIDEIETS